VFHLVDDTRVSCRNGQHSRKRPKWRRPVLETAPMRV
jgi:hypothetical protein